MKKLLLFLVLNSSSQLLFAQAGSLNTSFGSGGKATTSLGSSNARSYRSAIQSDGKIVVAGNRQNGSNNDFAITRFNADGSLDAGFGAGGQVVTDFGNEDNLASIAIQPDGKIVVAGHVSNGSDFDFAVARYNADGTPDPGFGTAGKVVLSIASGNDYVAGVHIQSDGKIIVTGTMSYYLDYVLVRFNMNGSLDKTFGNQGIVISDVYAYDWALASVLQPDGKIVLAGYTYQGGNTWEIARYNSDGTLDASFGNNNTDGTFAHGGGSVVGGMGGVIYGLALQVDGKIVAVGPTGNGIGVIRYNADGSFDHSFNGDGRITTTLNGNAAANAVEVQSDGKILVGGYSTVGSSEDFVLIRYASDGTLDASFGSGGMVTTDFNGQQDNAFSVKVNGNTIYVSGFAFAPTPSFAIAAYLKDATTTLPVTLVDFTGRRADNQVLLDWHTTYEMQAATFEIERSDNGRNFSRIGIIPVTSLVSERKSYQFIDERPLQGTSFYRLKLLDQNGSFHYSNIIAIRAGGKASSFNLFPNPASNLLQVQVEAHPGKIVLEIQDALGHTLQSHTVQSSGTSLSTSIVIESLESGMYYLVIKTGDGIQSAKFIKH